MSQKITNTEARTSLKVFRDPKDVPAPVAGDVWSLHTPKELIDTPSPLVLLLQQDPDDAWKAAPVFDGDGLASEADLLLSKEADFLDGHRWVAAKDSVSLKESNLWNYLEKVSRSTLDQVVSFRNTGVCSLKTGFALIPELGDPRIPIRQTVLGLVDRCVRAGD